MLCRTADDSFGICREERPQTARICRLSPCSGKPLCCPIPWAPACKPQGLMGVGVVLVQANALPTSGPDSASLTLK